MSTDLKYLALAVVAVAALLPRSSGRSIELAEMINRTVCAIEVRFDVDPDRIPQRIKIIKCAERTDQGCKANRIGSRHCCHHDNKMECVEMMDSVLVFNKKLQAAEKIEVSVGCACMIRGAHHARDVLDVPDVPDVPDRPAR